MIVLLVDDGSQLLGLLNEQEVNRVHDQAKEAEGYQKQDPHVELVVTISPFAKLEDLRNDAEDKHDNVDSEE